MLTEISENSCVFLTLPFVALLASQVDHQCLLTVISFLRDPLHFSYLPFLVNLRFKKSCLVCAFTAVCVSFEESALAKK